MRLSARSASSTRSWWPGWAAVDDLAEPEGGRDQRGVGLDVGAHHEDVARLQRRVVLEQTEEHLAEHVDLAGRTVAAVDLDRAVVGGERAPCRGDGVGGEVGLQPAEQGGGTVRRPASASSTASTRARRALQLADVAARGWPAAGGRPGRWLGVVAPRRRARAASDSACQSASPGWGSHRWTSWWVGERVEQLDLGDRAAGCGRRGRAGAAGPRPRRAAGRAPACRSWGGRGADPVDQRAPERRLPRQVVGQRRPSAVGRLRPRASRPAAAAAARRTTRRARRAGGRPRSGDRGAGRPPHPNGRGRGGRRAVRPRTRRGTRRCTVEQRPRQRVGAHGSSRVVPASSATSDRGERNSTPAQTPSSPRGPPPSRWESRWRASARPPAGTSDQLARERVVERAREQVGEAVGEQVGALGAVEVERHALLTWLLADPVDRRRAPT